MKKNQPSKKNQKIDSASKRSQKGNKPLENNDKDYNIEFTDSDDEETAMAKLQELVSSLVKKEVAETHEKQNTKISTMKLELDDVKSENVKMKRMIERLNFELCKRDEKIEKLESQIDDLKQEKLENNVRIVGLEEHDRDEDDVHKMAKEYKMKLKKSDIAEIIRLGKQGKKKKCRDVIVRFKDKAKREEFYRCRKMNREKNAMQGVYINDHLTESRSKLFYSARQLVRHKKINSAWTQGGNVLVRIQDTSSPLHITTQQQLRDINLQMDDSDDDYGDNNGRYDSSIYSYDSNIIED